MDQQFEPPPLPLLVAAAVFGCFVALLGFVVARCCYRRVRRDHDCVEVLPTLSEEELEAAGPPIARPRGFWRSCAGSVVPVRRAHAALVEAPRLARCVFHRPAGGSGRWPVEMEVSLDGVVTVQELQSVLSSAYDALAEAGDAPLLCAPSAAGVCVEYRVARGHPRRRLLDDADLGVALSRVLHVTSCGPVAVARGAREKRPRGSPGSLGAPSPGREWGRCAGTKVEAAAVDDGCAAAAAADDDLLIDVSLSGCVGVRSTYGGLAISGEQLPPPRAAVAVAAAGHPIPKRKLGGGGHTARPRPIGSVRR